MRILKTFLSLALLSATAMLRPNPAAAEISDRPNVIVVVGDDYGWPYYSFLMDHLRSRLPEFFPGDPSSSKRVPPVPNDPLICDDDDPAGCEMRIDTPNLDRLAREGIVFPHGYATEAACQPAHESLYTGLHQRDLGLAVSVGCNPNGNHGAQTFPEALKAAGYNTYKAGRFYGPNSAWTDYTDEREVGERKSMAAVKHFIEGQDSQTPWLVLWTPLAPHQEYAGIPTHIKGDYDAMETSNPPHIDSVFSSDTATRQYFEALTYYDERVGEIVEFLELLEDRSCDLGQDYSATQGVPGNPAIPTVHDAADAQNPLTQADANHRIVKSVACQTTPGQPCPSVAAGCQQERTQPSSCKPDPFYDPYGKPSSIPLIGSTTSAKCLAGAPAFPETAEDRAAGIRRYAGFRTNTLIIYIMDNGAGIQQSKGQFTENGLRTPIIVNYPRKVAPTGLLHPDTGAQPNGIYPHPALVGSIDIFPTLLSYANEPEREFPDAQSFRALIENPWQTYPNDWRRYFFGNTGAITGAFSVTSSQDATVPGNPDPLRMKIVAHAAVTNLNYVTHIRELRTDPFEIQPKKPPQYLPSDPNTPRYGTTPAVTHLQNVLDYWKTIGPTGCMDECERCKVISQLSDVACGGQLDPGCGSCTIPANDLPCNYPAGS